MRRSCVVITIVVALVLVLSAAACGTSVSRAPSIGDPPEDILAAAISASNEVTSGTGGFDFELTVDADESQIPPEDRRLAQMLLDGVTVSGTFAYAEDPMAADYSVSLELAGQPLEMGMRMQDSGFWVSYAGSWYEMPPEAMQAFAGSSTQVDPKEMERLLEDLAFDPLTWFKDLAAVGEESLDGVNTIHLAGSPDYVKMLSDVFELLRNEKFLHLIDPSGEMSSGMMGSGFPPSPAEIEVFGTEIDSMLQGLTIDFWVGTDDSMVRKIAVAGHIAPPPGEDPDGLLGIDINVSTWLDSINQPLAIEAPKSPLPFTELQSAIMEDPGPLGMLMNGFGFDGAGSEGPPTIY
jgi:hypothetical protein